MPGSAITADEDEVQQCEEGGALTVGGGDRGAGGGGKRGCGGGGGSAGGGLGGGFGG